MSLIKKIWNDSVGSKVIAVIISPYVLALLAAVKGFFNETGYITSLKNLLLYSVGVPVWLIPIIILVTIYITLFFVQYRGIDKSVIRHQGPYITFKDQPQEQRYCAVCWDTKHVKIQLPHFFDDTFKCPICHNEGAYDYEKKAPTYPPIMRF